MKIETPNGPRDIKLLKFGALDGWDIKDQFIVFASNKDAKERRAYMLRVLSYARVVLQKHELPLSTGALIDNHLGSSGNVGAVFHGVLKFNGIDPEQCAKETHYRTAIAGEIASSFISECFAAASKYVSLVSESADG